MTLVPGHIKFAQRSARSGRRGRPASGVLEILATLPAHMVDASLSTQAREPNGSYPRSGVAILLALISSVAFVLFHAPTVVLIPVNIFDEGLQLASGAFADKGLIAFRDYYVPYGPANAYLLAALRSVGFDSLEASRTLFLLLNGAVAGIGSYLVIRRTGILAAVVFSGLVLAFPPASSYTGVVLLVIASYLTAIGWRMTFRARPLVEQPSANGNTRLLIAGILLALTVWFRWEFIAILAVWIVLVLQRPKSGNQAKFTLVLVPAAIAAVPYVAIVALGGGTNLFDAVEYALFGYPRYRSLPFPLTAPWELFSLTWSNRTIPYNQLVFTMSYFAIALALLLLVIGLFAKRHKRWQWARVFERDDTRMIVIVGATAGFLLLSLRTRPDVAHASQLMLLGWLAVLWNRPRYSQLGVTVAVLAISTLSVLTIQSLQSNSWAAASSQIQSSAIEELPRLRYVTVGNDDDDADLREIFGAWNQYRLANPFASDAILVANRSNSMTFANAPIVYWLLDAPPAHWLTTFDPGFADQEGQQRQMIDALCESGAALVLREPLRGAGQRPDGQVSDALDGFIRTHYVIVHSTERYDLLRPSETGCDTAHAR